jgi:hypothetical protein
MKVMAFTSPERLQQNSLGTFPIQPQNNKDFKQAVETTLRVLCAMLTKQSRQGFSARRMIHMEHQPLKAQRISDQIHRLS